MKTVKISELNKLLTDYSQQEKDVKPLFLFFPSDSLCEDMEDSFWRATCCKDEPGYGIFLAQPLQLKNEVGYNDDDYCWDVEEADDNPLHPEALKKMLSFDPDKHVVYFFSVEWLQEKESVPEEFIEEHFDPYVVKPDMLEECCEWIKRLDLDDELPVRIEFIKNHPELYYGDSSDQLQVEEQTIARELDLIYRWCALYKPYGITPLSAIPGFRDLFIPYHKKGEMVELVYEGDAYSDEDVVRALINEIPRRFRKGTVLYLQDGSDDDRIYLSLTPNAKDFDFMFRTWDIGDDDDGTRLRIDWSYESAGWIGDDAADYERSGVSYIKYEE